MEKTYTLNEIAMMSGFTERTLRTYLKQGFLKGEKINGKWQFDDAAVDAFFTDPYVKEGLRIRRSSLVFDYLSSMAKTASRACVIIDRDVSLKKGAEISDFFCEAMKEAHDVDFNYGFESGHCRVILCGDEAQVTQIMKKFHEKD